MKRTVAKLLIVAVVLVGAISWWRYESVHHEVVLSAHQTQVTLGDTSVVADLADTPALREQGLSGRAALDDSHGMLFVFQEDGQPAFWMKDMLISIDMIWITADKKVVYIVPNAAPETYPESFRPDAQSRYVLEVPAGWAARHKVTLGSSASF